MWRLFLCSRNGAAAAPDSITSAVSSRSRRRTPTRPSRRSCRPLRESAAIFFHSGSALNAAQLALRCLAAGVRDHVDQRALVRRDCPAAPSTRHWSCRASRTSSWCVRGNACAGRRGGRERCDRCGFRTRCRRIRASAARAHCRLAPKTSPTTRNNQDCFAIELPLRLVITSFDYAPARQNTWQNARPCQNARCTRAPRSSRP